MTVEIVTNALGCPGCARMSRINACLRLRELLPTNRFHRKPREVPCADERQQVSRLVGTMDTEETR
ncbi:hypothetical protein KXD97_00200 [Mycobacterium sp. SMC-8]|uniref:hypothetical protein n=1 Tax=Mycobacterium sp. SMC-8 TaxID=2857060 RepID=UPI0021B3FFCC|nr:hypothetical protein [Mycobacterium sp. SMC-8]UXA12381.1 hypothetical protein KXD97_00200 [Mycobacterium sp. SMC-8]